MAYALRCAFLHNGDGEVANQKIFKKPKYQDFFLGIKKVKFLANPTTNLTVSKIDSTVVLNPRIYCLAILEGVRKWIEKNESNQEVLNRTEELIIFE